MCLNETQKKIRDVNFGSNVIILEQMRDLNDRKGGGLMILHRNSKDIKLEKIESINRDILVAKGSISGWDVVIIVVYFSVSDRERNYSIRIEIENILGKRIDEAVLIVGDFNGHIGYLGEQNLDANGKMILDWLEKYKVTLLNDVKCSGLYTWSRDEQKSVIDFAIGTNKFYEKYNKMEIDEKQYKFDLTDHNLMEIHLNIGNEKRKFNRKTWITREYYKTDKKSLEKYSMKLKDSITAQKVNNMKDLESRIIKTANVHLKKHIEERT